MQLHYLSSEMLVDDVWSCRAGRLMLSKTNKFSSLWVQSIRDGDGGGQSGSFS